MKTFSIYFSAITAVKGYVDLSQEDKSSHPNRDICGLFAVPKIQLRGYVDLSSEDKSSHLNREILDLFLGNKL
jgi:hypothetical protein